MEKTEELVKLKEKIQADQSLPLRAGATQLVFGEGSPKASIYLLGEAPGYWEDQKGRPFVGPAGQLLNDLLQSIGLKREEVYISNVVRFRPPDNRDPLPEEIAAFAPYVDEEIAIINPKLIVTLGRFSMGKFLPNEKISQIHGRPRLVRFHGKALPAGRQDITVLPMFHPAAALRSDEVMQKLKEDFKKIPELLEKELEKSIPKPEQGTLF